MIFSMLLVRASQWESERQVQAGVSGGHLAGMVARRRMCDSPAAHPCSPWTYASRACLRIRVAGIKEYLSTVYFWVEFLAREAWSPENLVLQIKYLMWKGGYKRASAALSCGMSQQVLEMGPKSLLCWSHIPSGSLTPNPCLF